MSLTGRFSALFLAALSLVLVGFSAALYLAARVYLDRQADDRLNAALAVLAAAAEIHPGGVEWEPQERALPLGQEAGPDRLRWVIFDDQGRRVDHSRNLADRDLTPEWTPRPGSAELPPRVADREGHRWRVAQRTIRPDSLKSSGSRAAALGQGPIDPGGPGRFPPSLVITACAPLGPTEATLATLAWLLAALSVVSWLLAAALCRRLSRRALAPLTRMVASARGLDAADPGWSLEQAGTGDELDELGRAFNDLLSRLHVAYERQRRFGGDASHQLRTPLTVLIGQIEVALRHERSGEEYRRTLKSALGRALHLGQIVEALTFLSRAEADAHSPECEPLDLGRWAAAEVEARHEPGRPVEVMNRGDGPLRIRSHTPLLGQLLDNLLDNARKYGRPGGLTRVETFRDGPMAVLAIEDDGPGIATVDLPHVFEPFYRSTTARRDGVSGVGLGLSIVQRVASALGGVAAIRQAEGHGCRVEVRFPLIADAATRGAETANLPADSRHVVT